MFDVEVFLNSVSLGSYSLDLGSWILDLGLWILDFGPWFFLVPCALNLVSFLYGFCKKFKSATTFHGNSHLAGCAHCLGHFHVD